MKKRRDLPVNRLNQPNLSHYFRTVTLPPQNSAETKKLGGRRTVRKSPIDSTNNQWGMEKTPTD